MGLGVEETVAEERKWRMSSFSEGELGNLNQQQTQDIVAGTLSTVMLRSWGETGSVLCSFHVLSRGSLWNKARYSNEGLGMGRCQLTLSWSPQSAVTILANNSSREGEDREHCRQAWGEARVAKPSGSSTQSCPAQADTASERSCLHFTRFLVLPEAAPYWTWMV